MSLILESLALLLLCVPAAARQTELQTELQRIPAPPPPDGNPYYNFCNGARVALSEDWAAISDPCTSGTDGGEVYLYRRSTVGWVFVQRLIGEYGSGFGNALALDGDTLIVGAEQWGWPVGFLGRVHVFQWTGTSWIQTQEIHADGLSIAEHPNFGTGVAVSDGILVIGAPGVDDPVSNGGEVRIYEHSGTAWVLVASFRLPPIPAVLNGDYYYLGVSAGVSGNTIIVGAYGKFGAAYVYERGLSGWTNAAILENPAPDRGDNFGWSVDISGGVAVIGEPAVSNEDSPAGLAHIYQRDQNGNWPRLREIRASDGFGGGDSGDHFGSSVAIDGMRCVAGAPNGRHNGVETGTVYLFQHHQDGWPATESYRFIASDSSGLSDRLGWSVDIRESLVHASAIGAWHEDIREGKAYAFAVELGTAYCEVGGPGGNLGITGSEAAGDQRLVLTVHDTPPQVRGIFFLSPRRGSFPFGNKVLCLDMPVARLGTVLTGHDGVALFDIDFAASWLAGKLIAGSTWYFQLAHERHSGSGRLDLVTNAVSLMLQ